MEFLTNLNIRLHWQLAMEEAFSQERDFCWLLNERSAWAHGA